MKEVKGGKKDKWLHMDAEMVNTEINEVLREEWNRTGVKGMENEKDFNTEEARTRYIDIKN